MKHESISHLQTQLQLINLHIALERLDGDLGLFREIAQDFLDTYEEAYRAVARAAEAENGRELQLTAHSLKGAVRDIGAEATQAAAYRLEMMGRLNVFEGSDAALICLQTTLEDLAPELEHLAQV